MKQKIVFLIIISLLYGCKKTFYESFNKSVEDTIVKKGKKIFVSGYEIRKKLIDNGYLSFIGEKDTLFLLESYDLPSETTLGSIWTIHKKVNYSYSNGKITELEKTPFGDEITSLVSHWDTVNIKKESSQRYNRFNQSDYIVGYKVYRLNGNNIVDKIIFQSFK